MATEGRLAREKPFGWGIIGTGTIAGHFAADLGLLPQARLVAVQSRSREKAEGFAARLGAARAYHDEAAFLADPAIEAVYIATPNHLHAAQALGAIAAGKPVLIEKPIALASAAVAAIAQAAQERGVFAMEALWSRFLPAVRRAREQIAKGRIGPVRRVRADLSYRHPEQGRFFDPALGGGAAFDLGVYPLSLALHLLGEPRGLGGSWLAAGTGVDRRTTFRLDYPAAVAELSCGFDRNGANRLLVEGERGGLVFEAPFLKVQRLTWYADAGRAAAAYDRGAGRLTRLLDRLPRPGRVSETLAFPGNGLQFQAEAAMAAIRAGETSCAQMPLHESAAVLRIIEAVRAGPPAAS
ncbi:Gfo/Idh/MocA family oxidoreductase [Bosea sp. (in: a-proteobacteria)]|uniref:Gfo/Idh/MocA family protein n=1 Tax=Bosea sp. (in: a-proteobacteria) TaxID=1871050 RepID=UPI0026181532|nr:Gfo/Idh/MocA family oxidoreductase [Bosea sp. (in: a-proteobacteria)]MCO5090725.1 Gfo/Idh/MocA family oxidoreductase [Bosea sp. (in: a-proteobacteria)]